MLIPFPFAYLFGSAVLDLWARATGRREWFRTAHHMNLLGLGSSVAAAVPGLIDYVFAVPPQSSGRQRATNHMFANLSAVALFAAARAGRRGPDAPPSVAAIAAELAGAGLLAAGGWLGGTLVYRNQIAVDHRYAGAGKYKVEALPPQRLQDREADVGAADELQVDQMKLVRIGPERIVIARTEEGYVAFDDSCPHRGASLADGAMACGVVHCPWHGSQFDVRTGAVKHGPAEKGIPTYEVAERGGRLWLTMPRRTTGTTA